jgi:hypothetical protein
MHLMIITDLADLCSTIATGNRNHPSHTGMQVYVCNRQLQGVARPIQLPYRSAAAAAALLKGSSHWESAGHQALLALWFLLQLLTSIVRQPLVTPLYGHTCVPRLMCVHSQLATSQPQPERYAHNADYYRDTCRSDYSTLRSCQSCQPCRAARFTE